MKMPELSWENVRGMLSSVLVLLFLYGIWQFTGAFKWSLVTLCMITALNLANREPSVESLSTLALWMVITYWSVFFL